MERRYGVQIHHMMALCGGFLGVYAIVNRMGVFASAQTSNLIELVCDLLGRELGLDLALDGVFPGAKKTEE